MAKIEKKFEALLKATLKPAVIDQLLDKKTKGRDEMFRELASVIIKAVKDAGLVLDTDPAPKKAGLKWH